MGGCKLTIYMNPYMSKNKMSEEHTRGRARTENGALATQSRKTGWGQTEGPECQLPTITSCVTLGSFSNLSVLLPHFSRM